MTALKGIVFLMRLLQGAQAPDKPSETRFELSWTRWWDGESSHAVLLMGMFFSQAPRVPLGLPWVPLGPSGVGAPLSGPTVHACTHKFPQLFSNFQKMLDFAEFSQLFRFSRHFQKFSEIARKLQNFSKSSHYNASKPYTPSYGFEPLS